MILLIDTDILIDVAINRLPHAEDSANTLQMLELQRAKIFVAWHTLSNFFYLVRPKMGKKDTLNFIGKLLKIAQVSPTETSHLKSALSLNLPDFEDGLQVAAALACDADYIISRNLKDYKKSPIKAISPTQFLAMID